MPIQDFIEVTVDLTVSHQDTATFEDGWRAGYAGEPIRLDASESWRNAHAMGAQRRGEAIAALTGGEG